MERPSQIWIPLPSSVHLSRFFFPWLWWNPLTNVTWERRVYKVSVQGHCVLVGELWQIAEIEAGGHTASAGRSASCCPQWNASLQWLDIHTGGESPLSISEVKINPHRRAQSPIAQGILESIRLAINSCMSMLSVPTFLVSFQIKKYEFSNCSSFPRLFWWFWIS